MLVPANSHYLQAIHTEKPRFGFMQTALDKPPGRCYTRRWRIASGTQEAEASNPGAEGLPFLSSMDPVYSTFWLAGWLAD